MADPTDHSGVFTLVDDDDLSPEERARVIAGRYEIIERIGEGGMGQILHVRHRRLGKSFALKLMLAEASMDPEACRIFKREARLASTLSHPNIVSIVDFGEDPDWGLFITQELLRGESLAERIRDAERLPVDIACRVALQLADALDHSHSHLIVHGDIKADNVLCVSEEDDDDQWQVKLLDFGTAEVATHSRLRDHAIAGTPEYLAPERIQGAPPTPSIDIYALGTLLYEMLCGTPPFVGPDWQQILERQLTEPPEPVGARRGEVLDDQLVVIVDRALAKDPADRYASARELHDDLAAYMEHVGVRQRELEQRVGIGGVTREQAAADAFDSLRICAAGLDSRGTINVANPAMATLLGSTVDDLEGRNVLGTRLGSLHTNIRDDVRIVAMSGKLVRRRLRIPRADGTDLVLRLTLTPAPSRAGACTLTIEVI